MTDDLIGQIQTFTLSARMALETEAGQQLEGIYGWLPDGTFGNANGYPALVNLGEARETRQRLEQFAEDEKVAGLDAKNARRKLIRETAFTWLNRLAAFRLMEERRLLKPTIVRLAQSNGFIFWLTDEKTPEGQQSYVLHQQGGLPLNEMGEGPSDIAYRRFLLWQSGELAREVSLLFDAGTLSSRLCPRPSALKQIVGEMNAEGCVEAWKPGNEETIGWIYEGFIEQENKDVFEKFSKGKKVLAEEIGAATQRFTPRWIVRFLVENSLGRLWVEMHPDSRLANSLTYLVPVEKPITRPLKSVSEITFLDPCCGSMHFGFVAFDLFVEMYREEMERAGQPGWPEKASVANADEIATSIAASNLFGIDIDARAVQIAALALLIKARTLQPKAHVTDLNLACANVEQISGGKLDAFIAQAKFTHPIYERILRSLSARMKDSDHVGSLLRLEKILEQLIAEERRKAEAGKQFEMSFPGLPADQFKTQEGIEEFFGLLSEQVLRHLDEFVRATRAAGSDPGHFVNETAKGLRYLRLVSRHHDVVATNPPYMSRRNMSAVIGQHLDEQYAKAKGDLYAAFIWRCTELAAPLGKVAMVTQQSFMFISTYEDLRDELRANFAVETMVHLGAKAFRNVKGENVNTTAFVLRREGDALARDQQAGLYFRMVREPTSEAKTKSYETALSLLRNGETHPQVFRCVQREFDAIPRKPWVYFIGPSLRKLFTTFPPLEELALPRIGGKTSENFRFLRFWWEVGLRKIDRRCASHAAAADSSLKWFPYAKGGVSTRWYGNYFSVVNWARDGLEIKDVINGKRKKYSPNARGDLWSAWLNSYDYYFKQGVAYSFLSSKAFSARLLPTGFIFDVSASAIFGSPVELVLGVLNSVVGEFLLYLLNPTVNSQIGDLCRLPMPPQSSDHLTSLVNEALNDAMKFYRFSERTLDFIGPPPQVSMHDECNSRLLTLEKKINLEVARLYGLTDADVSVIDREMSELTEPSESVEIESDASNTDDSEDEVGIPNTSDTWAQSWISYAFGTVLGRFDIGEPGGLGHGDSPPETVVAIRKLIDSDGIMASDANHPQDIIKCILACLELMLGRDAAHATIRTATGDNGDIEDALRDWIDRQFWKYHHQQYRKRPVYWPLQSPKKKFTVWVFHELFSKDTLFRIKDQFVQVKINWLNARIRDLKPKTLSTDTRERRAAEKEISQLSDALDDVQEFAERLKRITERGYTPHIDDGVLLNAAPLWELLPSWPDAKKAWQELENEEYEWAQQAMENWPDRVKKVCQTNRSFAIAHGSA